MRKRIRTAVLSVFGLALVGGITVGLTKLKPAAPTLDRSTAVIDTVKRGQMLREVRGISTLVPELIRWVPAPADGRVEKILVQAGVEVSAGTVIVELSNPPHPITLFTFRTSRRCSTPTRSRHTRCPV